MDTTLSFLSLLAAKVFVFSLIAGLFVGIEEDDDDDSDGGILQPVYVRNQ